MAKYVLRIVGAFEREVEAESLEDANKQYADAEFSPVADPWDFVGLGSAVFPSEDE